MTKVFASLHKKLKTFILEYIYIEDKFNEMTYTLNQNKILYQNDINELIKENELDIPKLGNPVSNNILNENFSLVKYMVHSIGNEDTDTETKKIYHELMKITHPDKNSTLTSLNQKINIYKNNIIHLINFCILLDLDLDIFLNSEYINDIFERYTPELNKMKERILAEEKNLLYDYTINKDDLIKKYLLNFI